MGEKIVIPKDVMYAEVRDNETQCGIGRFKPGWLQCFANMRAFTGFYAIAGLFSATISVYVPSQITTLERYFGFSSAQSGFILSCNDIGFLVLTLFISNFATRVHRPRVLAMTTLFFGVSGLICTLAYFTSPTFMTEGKGILTSEKHKIDGNETQLISLYQGGQLCTAYNVTKCGAELTNLKVGAPTGFTKIALMIFAVGMILQGIAKSPRQPFVTTYIDDNVKPTKTALYLGTISGLGIFGPAIAFGLGGIFTKTYITLEDVYITPMDPRWVGAWWLGFLCFGTMAILSSIPLLFFPRRMKPKLVTGKPRKIKIKLELKEFFKGLWKLVYNKPFMLCVLSSCVNLFVIGSYLAFMPKYFETQFQIPAWQANIIMGLIGVLSASLGSYLGGLLTSACKLGPVRCAQFMLGISIFSVVVPIVGIFLGCNQPHVIGNPKSMNAVTNSSCFGECMCDHEDYFPVCGSDGNNYFSPCHAGCTTQNKTMFTECRCIGRNATATPGLCDSNCNMFYPYMVVTAVAAFVSTLGILPSIIFSIRCVTSKEKPLAVGLSTFLQTLLGWFPGPIVLGKVVDSSCLFWSISCEGQGACTMYDIDDFRIKRHVTEIIAKFIVIVMQIFMVILAMHKKWPGPQEDNVVVSSPEGEALVNGTKPETNS